MSRGKTVAAVVGTIVSAVALGMLSGWLTGQSGPNDTVVAAAIPAILSLGGGALAFVSARARDMVGAVHAVAFIVAFCVFFKVSVTYAVEERREDNRLSAIEAKEAHLRDMEKCSKAERLINEGRTALELNPLPPGYFCKTPPW